MTLSNNITEIKKDKLQSFNHDFKQLVIFYFTKSETYRGYHIISEFNDILYCDQYQIFQKLNNFSIEIKSTEKKGFISFFISKLKQSGDILKEIFSENQEKDGFNYFI